MSSRKKEAPPPLFSVKAQFTASLENVCQQAIMMLTAAETILQHGDLKPATGEILTERLEALRESLYGPDPS